MSRLAVALADDTVYTSQVFFGQHDWDLPPAPRPHPELKQRCAVFASALLAGQVKQTPRTV